MNAIVLCVCGWLHVAIRRLDKVPVVHCPFAPTGQLWLMNVDERRIRVRVPRPEAVW